MYNKNPTLAEVKEYNELYEQCKRKGIFSSISDKFGIGTLLALMLSGEYNKFVLKNMLKESSKTSTKTDPALVSTAPENFLINYPRRFMKKSNSPNVDSSAMPSENQCSSKSATQRCSIQ